MIARAALAAGRPIPERIANAPDLLPGMGLFLKAFIHLDTERAPGQYLPGVIPWSAIERYARMTQIEDRDHFHSVIRQVDDWHLAQIAEKLKKDGAQKPSPKSRLAGKGNRG